MHPILNVLIYLLKDVKILLIVGVIPWQIVGIITHHTDDIKKNAIKGLFAHNNILVLWIITVILMVLPEIV